MYEQISPRGANSLRTDPVYGEGNDKQSSSAQTAEHKGANSLRTNPVHGEGYNQATLKMSGVLAISTYLSIKEPFSINSLGRRGTLCSAWEVGHSPPRERGLCAMNWHLWGRMIRALGEVLWSSPRERGLCAMNWHLWEFGGKVA